MLDLNVYIELCGFLVFLVGIGAIYAIFLDPLRWVPGPFSSRFTKVYVIRKAFKGELHTAYRDLHRKYGSVVRVGPNEVIVSDTSAIPKLYGVDNNFAKSNIYTPFCGFDTVTNRPVENLFSTRDREHHKRLRSSVAQAYSLSTLRQLEPLVDSCTQIFIDKMTDMSGRIVALDDWVQYYAFDVIAMITFNKTFGFMEDRDKNRDQVLGGLHHGDMYNAVVSKVPFMHRLLLGNAYSIKLLMKIPAMRKANPIILIDSLIDEAVENHQPQKLTPRGDHLDTFRAFQHLNPHRFSESDFRSCLQANLFAGSDTIAIGLRAVFYYLLKSPNKYEKLIREIDAADANGSLSPMITYPEGMQLVYLQAVIKESLRISPALATPLERVIPPGGAQIGEHFYPGGTAVGASIWVINFATDVYGDDADVFRPERWIKADSETLKHMERAFLSFGQGTRTCIGKSIALLEMTKFIPQLLRHFQLEWAIPDQDWKTEGYNFAKQTNMPIRLIKRTTKA